MVKNFSYNINYIPIKLPCSKCGKYEDRAWNLPYMCFECEGRHYPTFFMRIKMDIKERDNFKCVCCGISGKLAVHHIDKDKRNNRPSNLITICPGCHTSFHSKKSYKIFKDYGLKEVLRYIKKRRKLIKRSFKL